MSEEELVEVTVSFPGAFIENIERQKWFSYYCDLEDFIVDAVRRAETEWIKQWPTASELLNKYFEAKARKPGLSFVEFLESITWTETK